MDAVALLYKFKCVYVYDYVLICDCRRYSFQTVWSKSLTSTQYRLIFSVYESETLLLKF